MTTYKIESRGFQDISSALGKNRPLVFGALNKMLRRSGGVLVPALKRNTPRRTGKLRASTRFQIKGETEDMRLEIRQGARTPGGDFYRPYVTDGTRPHEIRPVTARALRFTIGGRTVFAKKVNHPGTRANPYHKRTVREMAPEIERIANEEAQTLASRLLD